MPTSLSRKSPGGPGHAAGMRARGHGVTPKAQGGGFFWSADSQRACISRASGDLWQVAAAGAVEPSAVWTTPQAGVGHHACRLTARASPSCGRVRRAGGGRGDAGSGARRPWRRSRRRRSDDPHARRRARESVVVRADNHAIGGLAWSPDGKAIVFSDNNRTIRHEQTPAYSGSKIIYTISENVPGETDVVNADGTGMKPLKASGGCGGRRWLDATHFVYDRTSPDFKRRTMSVASIGGGEPKVLHEDAEEQFWSITGDAGAGAQPSPNGKWIGVFPQRQGRLGSPLCDAGGRRRRGADHEREVRGPGAAMVARQHAHRIRRERTGSLRRSPFLRGDDWRRSGHTRPSRR